jgi:hypothetical protein
MKKMASPLKKMKDQFGTKDKLVAAVVTALDKKEEGLAARLKTQSNSKLLRLLEKKAKKA